MLLRWDTSENLCPNNSEVFVSFPPENLPFHHFQNIKKGRDQVQCALALTLRSVCKTFRTTAVKMLAVRLNRVPALARQVSV